MTRDAFTALFDSWAKSMRCVNRMDAGGDRAVWDELVIAPLRVLWIASGGEDHVKWDDFRDLAFESECPYHAWDAVRGKINWC